jgi:hypothetical protein
MSFTRLVYFLLVISVNNSAVYSPLSDSNASASECESGELNSDEYPSQIKFKPLAMIHDREHHPFDSTQEMETLAQLLNHSFPIPTDRSLASDK